MTRSDLRSSCNLQPLFAKPNRGAEQGQCSFLFVFYLFPVPSRPGWKPGACWNRKEPRTIEGVEKAASD